MATTSLDINTKRVVDPRIQPRPVPSYLVPIGPKQNQYYMVNNSAISSSYVAFNNLTTLGADRAYLDTFELLITAKLKFEGYNTSSENQGLLPRPEEWTFESFPFAKCCDIIRVNVNGTAFFSYPMQYLRAKERYWDEKRLNESYGNVCPCNKPYTSNEIGYATQGEVDTSDTDVNYPFHIDKMRESMKNYPYRLSEANYGYAFTSTGANGTTNNDIVPRAWAPMGSNWTKGCIFTATDGTELSPATGQPNAKRSYTEFLASPYTAPSEMTQTKVNTETTIKTGSHYTKEIIVQWREPVFCSPFSSRYDETFGRPLYNITSLDLSFNIQGLNNMVRYDGRTITKCDISLDNVQLLFQVLTLPTGLTRPPSSTIPYRRFIPYLTDFDTNTRNSYGYSEGASDGHCREIKMTSGQYTLNEIPAAIWIFAAPTKACYQTNEADGWLDYLKTQTFTTAELAKLIPGYNVNNHQGDGGVAFPDRIVTAEWTAGVSNMVSAHSCNKCALPMTHISIAMANTTQLLNTAKPADLYRIAKNNGCRDSFTCAMRPYYPNRNAITRMANAAFSGVGTYLRLIPGVDLILPEQDLIPGANANNMVFQVEDARFLVPDNYPYNFRHFALWILFEYVGVATLSPGQGQIVMNPLGDGRTAASAEIIPAPEDLEGESQVDGVGSGWWDKVKNFATKAHNWVKENKIISKVLPVARQVANLVPGGQAATPYLDKADAMAKKYGYGMKRPSPTGGAVRAAGCMGAGVMGMGDFV